MSGWVICPIFCSSVMLATISRIRASSAAEPGGRAGSAGQLLAAVSRATVGTANTALANNNAPNMKAFMSPRPFLLNLTDDWHPIGIDTMPELGTFTF